MDPNRDLATETAPANYDHSPTSLTDSAALKEVKDNAAKSAAARKRNAKSKARQGAKSKPCNNATSKQDRVLAMLWRKEGASVAAIMKTTGWQQHSVHGFLAGVVRKKLGLNLKSDEVDGKRIYRIVTGKASRSAASKRKRGR